MTTEVREVLNRGGGTSLSGETVNYAVAIDHSRYLTGVGEIDPERRLPRGAGSRAYHFAEFFTTFGIGPPPLEDRALLAGSWGFEQGKYDISMDCGEQALLPAVRDADADTLIAADGFSCKTRTAAVALPAVAGLAVATAVARKAARAAVKWVTVAE